MTSLPNLELDRQQTAARTAHIRFITAGAVLRRRELTSCESRKAKAIFREAFDALTTALQRVHEICTMLYPEDTPDPKRSKAPRYSSDARRMNILG